MPKPDDSSTLRNIDRRLSNVEQILPTLATRGDLATLTTKDELRAAIAPLATREEMHAAIAAATAPLATREEMHAAIEAAVAPLATKDQVREEAVETRRHFDVVAESLLGDIRLIAEEHVHLTQRMDTFEAETKSAISGLDRRVLRLEGKRGR